MQTKTTLWFYLIPVRMAKIKDTGDSLYWRGCGAKGSILHWWWAYELVQSLWKSIWWFLRKLGRSLPQDPAIPLLGIHPKDVQWYHKVTCSTMFTAGLSVVARTCKQPTCPSIKECVEKMWYIYKTESYSAVKWQNEICRPMIRTRK